MDMSTFGALAKILGYNISGVYENIGALKKLSAESVVISTTPKTYELPKNSVCAILLLSGDNSAVSGLWFCRTGSATIQYLEISKSSGITVSTNELNFTITKGSGTRNSTIVIYQLSDVI